MGISKAIKEIRPVWICLLRGTVFIECLAHFNITDLQEKQIQYQS